MVYTDNIKQGQFTGNIIKLIWLFIAQHTLWTKETHIQ